MRRRLSPCALLATYALLHGSTLSADEASWTNVNAFVTPADFSAGCAGFSWIDDGDCASLTSGPVTGEAFVWIVVSGSDGFDPADPTTPNGVSAVEFGVAHDLDISLWTLCSGGLAIPTQNWPASGSGISVTWSPGCYDPVGSNARVGYFYLQDGSSGHLAIHGHPTTGAISLVDCDAISYPICEGNAGTIDLEIGSVPACTFGGGGEPPTNLTATTEGCTVTLFWEHSGSGIDGFEVHRDGALIGVLPATARSFTDSPIPVGGETYTYEVAAVTDCSRQPAPPIAVDTPATLEAPSNVAAVAEPCFIEITWEHSGADVEGFEVARDGVIVGTTGPGARSFVEAGIPLLVATYNYEVTAITACSSQAAPPILVQGATLEAASDCAASSGLCSRIDVTWTDNSDGETGFKVFRDDVLVATVPPDSTKFSDMAPTPGALHSYQVVATASCGDAPPSNSAAGSAIPLPAASDCLASNDQCDRVDITWVSNGIDEIGFRILRDGDEVGFVGPEITVFGDYTTEAGVTYSYTVVAVYDCGDAAPSNADSGRQTTPSCRPSSINFNVLLTQADFTAGCLGFDWIDAGSCQSLVSDPIAGPAFLWVVVSDSDGFEGGFNAPGPAGITGAQFGIEHDLDLDSWTLCATGAQIPSEGWPASGTGNAVTWGACNLPPGNNARLGFFLLPDGATGTISLGPDPRNNELLITDCADRIFQACPEAAGSADLSIGTIPECDLHLLVPEPPADVTATTEGCNIRLAWTHDGNDVSTFEITRDGLLLATVSADVREYLDDTLPTAGGSFSYLVTTVVDCGGEASAGATGSTPAVNPASGCQASVGLCDRIDITWVDNSDDELGFDVLREGSLLASVGPDVTAFTDVTAVPGVAYQYRVVVVGPCGPGNPSNAAAGKRESAPGTAVDLTASEGLCHLVKLTWSDNSTNEHEQRVYRDGELIATLPQNANAYDDTDVQPDVVYSYVIELANVCGASQTEPVVGSATDDPPLAPADLSASDDICGAVIIAWTDESIDEAGFRVSRDGEEIASVGADVTSYQDLTAEPDVTYIYRVTAFNDCGDSGPSNDDPGTLLPEVSAIPAIVLLEPPADTECMDNPVQFVWGSQPGAVLYQIVLRLYCELPPVVLETTTPDTTIALNVPFGPHFWRVRGQNACGEWGEWSECRSVTIDPPLTAPAYFYVDYHYDEPWDAWFLEWASVLGAEHYELAVRFDGLCYAYGPETRLYTVAGTDTVLTFDEIGEEFYAWVSAIACGRRGDPSTCDGPPTTVPVVLEYFRARPVSGGVVTEWSTLSEDDVMAFHLYRDSDGEGPRRVTDAPIPSGASEYHYTDLSVEPGVTYTYALVELDDRGDERELARTLVTVPMLARSLSLSARPNPFNPSVTLTFELPAEGHVRLEVLDAGGRAVQRLVDEKRPAGRHQTVWNGTDASGRRVASGVYFVRVLSDGGERVKRITLLK